MESHYCRNSSSKHYLEPDWKSKSQLYDFYKKFCVTHRNNERPLSVATFHHMFSDLNLSLFFAEKTNVTCVFPIKQRISKKKFTSAEKRRSEDGKRSGQKLFYCGL